MIRQLKVYPYVESEGTLGFAKEVYIIFKDKIKEIERFLEKPRVNTIEDNSKVYFSKSVVFPRVKFREWVDARENINITRSAEKCDYCIIDIDAIEAVLARLQGFPVIELARNQEGDFVSFSDPEFKVEYAVQMLPKLFKSAEVIRVPEYSDCQKIIDMVSNIFDLIKMGEELQVIDVVDMINTTTNSKVIDAINVLDVIQLIKNTESRELGLEILYNCNYAKSIWFIGFILADQSVNVSSGHGNSVNRQTFFKYLDSIGITRNGRSKFHGIDLYNMGQLLDLYKSLNLYHLVDRRFVKNYVMEKVQELITTHINISGLEIVDYNVTFESLVDPSVEFEVSLENTP